MELSKKDKEFIKSIDKTDAPLDATYKQVEDAINNGTFAIFSESVDDYDYDLVVPQDQYASACKIITAEEARELFGDETFLEVAHRAAFHYSTSRDIPNTNGLYSITFDAGVIMNGVKSKLLSRRELDIDLDYIKNYQKTPNFIAKNIKWDFSDYEDGEETPNLPNVIKIPIDKMAGDGYEDEVSDYISNEVTGFCHAGFEIECNMTLDEVKEQLNKAKEESNSDLVSKLETAEEVLSIEYEYDERD